MQTIFEQPTEEEYQHDESLSYGNAERLINAGDLTGLPACVKLWLSSSGIIGKMCAKAVQLTQTGLMRNAIGGKWMPVRANQHFTIDEPSFIWQARVKMNPLVWFSGSDTFNEGRGRMLIKLWSLLPVVNAKGMEIDQGSMLRFLGEMSWFPFAALCPYVEWTGISEHTAKATMTIAGKSVSGIFQFDDDGRIRSFSAKRYMSTGKKSSLEHWHISMQTWKRKSGVRVPVQGNVTWQLKTGDFNCYKWKIRELDYTY